MILIFALSGGVNGLSFDTSTLSIDATNNMIGLGTISPTSLLHIWETSDSKPGGVTAATKTILKFSRTGTPDYSYNENAEFRFGHGGLVAQGQSWIYTLTVSTIQPILPINKL